MSKPKNKKVKKKNKASRPDESKMKNINGSENNKSYAPPSSAKTKHSFRLLLCFDIRDWRSVLFGIIIILSSLLVAHILRSSDSKIIVESISLTNEIAQPHSDPSHIIGLDASAHSISVVSVGNDGSMAWKRLERPSIGFRNGLTIYSNDADSFARFSQSHDVIMSWSAFLASSSSSRSLSSSLKYLQEDDDSFIWGQKADEIQQKTLSHKCSSSYFKSNLNHSVSTLWSNIELAALYMINIAADKSNKLNSVNSKKVQLRVSYRSTWNEETRSNFASALQLVNSIYYNGTSDILICDPSIGLISELDNLYRTTRQVDSLNFVLVANLGYYDWCLTLFSRSNSTSGFSFLDKECTNEANLFIDTRIAKHLLSKVPQEYSNFLKRPSVRSTVLKLSHDLQRKFNDADEVLYSMQDFGIHVDTEADFSITISAAQFFDLINPSLANLQRLFNNIYNRNIVRNISMEVQVIGIGSSFKYTMNLLSELGKSMYDTVVHRQLDSDYTIAKGLSSNKVIPLHMHSRTSGSMCHHLSKNYSNSCHLKSAEKLLLQIDLEKSIRLLSKLRSWTSSCIDELEEMLNTKLRDSLLSNNNKEQAVSLLRKRIDTLNNLLTLYPSNPITIRNPSGQKPIETFKRLLLDTQINFENRCSYIL